MPLNHLRVMRAVEVCRTAGMGGHKDKCDSCGHIEVPHHRPGECGKFFSSFLNSPTISIWITVNLH